MKNTITLSVLALCCASRIAQAQFGTFPSGAYVGVVLDVHGRALFKNGAPNLGTIMNIQANAGDEVGGGIAVSNEGGFFDYNDGFVTYKNLDSTGGLKVDANFTGTGHIRALDGEHVVPTTGQGMEMVSANGKGWLLAKNRATDTYLPLNLDGAPLLLNNASGGNVGIGTHPDPACKLDVAGQICATTLKLTSDRNAKSDFHAVDGLEVLKKVAGLPLSTWHYTNAPGVRHIGPMAQDFKAAFNLGEDDKHIATVDADGVALASIQALYEIVQEKDSEIAALQRQISTLKTELAGVKDSVTDRLAALEKGVSKDALQANFRPEALR